jgi:hypothetical protein
MNNGVNSMKMEDPVYGSAIGKEPGRSWSQAQVNQEFHVQELRFLFDSAVLS